MEPEQTAKGEKTCPGIQPGTAVNTLKYEVTPTTSEFVLGTTFASPQDSLMPQTTLRWTHGNRLSTTEVSHEFVHAEDLVPFVDEPSGRSVIDVESHMQKEWVTMPVTTVVSQAIRIYTHQIRVTGIISMKGKGEGKAQQQVAEDESHRLWD